MTDYLELEPEILAEVPQADVIVLRRSIARSVREFCEKTLVLDATASLDIVAGIDTYELPPVPQCTIVKIKRESVWWGNDRQLVQRSEDELDRDVGNPRAPGSSLSQPWRAMRAAVPEFFFQPRPWLIRLVPIPTTDAAARLKVTYHLKPSILATEIEDFVVENWYEILVAGALAALLSINHKPWTDHRKAAQHREDFLDGIDRVISERVSGFASNDYAVGRVKAWI